MSVSCTVSSAPPRAASAGLAAVLEHPKIWRGDALAHAPLPVVSTGFTALDAQLPGGGWPRSGLTEVLSSATGIGELSLLMPALAKLSTDELAWLICVAPPYTLYAPALADAGLALSRLLITSAQGRDAGWACTRALESDGIGAVLAWLPEAGTPLLRRLQQAAEASRTLLFVFRPAVCAAQASPAPLRLSLHGDGHQLQVKIIKRRGMPCSLPVALPLPLVSAGSPNHPTRHALDRPPSPAPAARILPQPASA